MVRRTGLVRGVQARFARNFGCVPIRVINEKRKLNSWLERSPGTQRDMTNRKESMIKWVMLWMSVSLGLLHKLTEYKPALRS